MKRCSIELSTNIISAVFHCGKNYYDKINYTSDFVATGCVNTKYHIAGNFCRELNFALCYFDVILQTFLPEIYNYLTLARIHASRVKQLVSQSCLCCAISLQVRDCLLLALCLC